MQESNSYRQLPELASLINQAILDPHLNKETIKVACEASKHFGFAGLCANPNQLPTAREILGKTSSELAEIQRFHVKQIEYNSSILTAAGTGYTGEEGFELLLPSSLGKKLWLELIDDEVIPCGLGARDTLRLEAAMHLYGHELTTETTPFEAGLG